MAFLSSIWRARRGDFNFFLVAALMALLIMPGAAHGALPPQGCEAVLFWLQNEPTAAVVASQVGVPSPFIAITHQKAETVHQISVESQFSLATHHCGLFSTLASPFPLTQPQLTPQELEFEQPVVARLNGVRTNRRLI